MKTILSLLLLSNVALAADPALTIYNDGFAVVRETVPLDLKAGVQDARFSGMTATAETDSVILRDPAGKVQFRVLEQSYRNDPISRDLLLSLDEGKTISFYSREPGKPDREITGKIVRSGYGAGGQNTTQPIIEVDGRLVFALPGEPMFPTLDDDTVLNPTLAWKLDAPEAAKLDAELAYVTDGFAWHSDYNIVAPEKSDIIDLVGWVTFDNNSGKTFRDAKIKLMAGDVNRVRRVATRAFTMARAGADLDAASAPMSEKAFSDYHLYTINHPATLRNHETKQVEFVRAQGVNAPRIYIYDGATMTYGNYNMFRGAGEYGPQMNKMNKKVWILREFKNSEENHLGMPLPKGRLRFYQQDDDRQLEFTGENEIDHTAKDETIRVYVGNSFDLAGERRRTSYESHENSHWLAETFEIKLRNHKKEAAEIRVVEHLSRFDNWAIKEKSDDFTKLDSHTIEFRETVQADEEKVVTYTVHYTW